MTPEFCPGVLLKLYSRIIRVVRIQTKELSDNLLIARQGKDFICLCHYRNTAVDVRQDVP